MKEQKSQFIPGLGILLLTIVLLGTVGALLRDFNGVRFGAWGAIIWGLAALSTFVLGTAYLSRRLLPIQDNLGWSNGFRLLWKNYLLGVAGLLSNNRQESSARYAPPKKKKSDEDEPAPSFKYLKAGFLFAHEAAAITNGSSYSRAAGPGLIILRGGETISQVFDLRRQSRKLPVSATTRDGIPVKTSISVTFQVRPPAPDQRRPRSIESDIIPYPYDPGALFELTYSAGMVDGQRRDWTEQVAPQAAALLITEIGKFSLDKLLESGGAGPLGTIKESIKRGLEDQQRDGNSQILSRGVKIVGISVGPLIGMIAGLISFVPYLGAIVGVMMGVVAALVQYQDWYHVMLVLVVFAVGQTLEGYVLVPKLVGDKIGLHPVAVMFAILAGGELFGFIGVLAALPVAAVVMVLLRYAYERYTQSEMYQDPADGPQIVVAGDVAAASAEAIVVVDQRAPRQDADPRP